MRKQTSATGARNGPAGFVDLVGRVKPSDGAPLFRDFEIVDSCSISNELFLCIFAQCEDCGEPRFLYC